ncbi:MAG: hypothetical protein JNJ80_25835 [Gemmatimonadetes bacterium]|nr:hypothetical protein [Gemmatimonadota bacterium]
MFPWILGAGAVAAVVSWSPLGRALLRYLQARRQDAAVNEQLLTELATLRQQLGEIVERLDATEQLLLDRNVRHLAAPPAPRELADTDRIPTPR